MSGGGKVLDEEDIDVSEDEEEEVERQEDYERGIGLWVRRGLWRGR